MDKHNETKDQGQHRLPHKEKSPGRGGEESQLKEQANDSGHLYGRGT